MLRKQWVAIIIGAVAVGAIAHFAAPTLIGTGLVIRTGAYSVMILAEFALALISLRAGYGKLSLLFALYLLAHLVSIISVLFSLYRVPVEYMDWLRNFLTPVVAVQAVVYILIILEWVEQRREVLE